MYNKKSREKDSELKVRAIAALDKAEDCDTPTIDWIKTQDIVLSDYTHQKLCRVLNNLVDMGLVRKGKSRSKNKMVYRLVSKMREDELKYNDKIKKAYRGIEWDFEDEFEEGDEEIDFTEYD